MPQFTLTGTRAMAGRLKIVQAKLVGESRAAIRKQGKEVLAVSQKRVPLDRGDLKATGKIRDATFKGLNLGVELTYDGPQALAIHEFHSKHDPPSWRNVGSLNFTTLGTGVDYLGGPLREARSGMAREIAGDIKL